MFSEEEEKDWQGAGRLFVALCIIRTERKLDPERGFSFSELTDPRAVRRVSAAHYLGYALRCFNSGLRNRGINMNDKAWIRCQKNRPICPLYAKILEAADSEIHEQQHGQADEPS